MCDVAASKSGLLGRGCAVVVVCALLPCAISHRSIRELHEGRGHSNVTESNCQPGMRAPQRRRHTRLGTTLTRTDKQLLSRDGVLSCRAARSYTRQETSTSANAHTAARARHSPVFFAPRKQSPARPRSEAGVDRLLRQSNQNGIGHTANNPDARGAWRTYRLTERRRW